MRPNSIQLPKPAINSYSKPCLKQRGGDRTVVPPGDSQQFSEASYYANTEIEPSILADPGPNQTDARRDTLLNLPDCTTMGPITSSPRRVTISNSVSRYMYPDEEDETALEQSNETNTDSQLSSTEVTAVPQKPILYTVDSTRLDPTYKPPPTASKVTPNDRRTSLGSSQRRLSDPSRIPRYNLRSKARKLGLQGSNGTSQRNTSPQNDNEPTNSGSHEATGERSQQSKSLTKEIAHNMQDETEIYEPSKETHALLIDLGAGNDKPLLDDDLIKF